MGQAASKETPFQQYTGRSASLFTAVLNGSGNECCVVSHNDVEVFDISEPDQGAQYTWSLEQEASSACMANELLVTGCVDGNIRCYTPETGQLVMILGTHSDGHMGPITCVCPVDADHIITGSEDTTLRLWSLREQRCIRVYHSTKKRSGGNGDGSGLNTTVESFSAAIPFMPELAVSSVCYDRVTGLVLAGYANGAIMHFQFESGKRVLQLGSNRPGVTVTTMVVLSKWGLLVFANADSTLRVWHLSLGKEVARYRFSVTALEYDEQRDVLFTGDEQGRVSMWKVMLNELPSPTNPSGGALRGHGGEQAAGHQRTMSGSSSTSVVSASTTSSAHSPRGIRRQFHGSITMPQIVAQYTIGSTADSLGRVTSVRYDYNTDLLMVGTESDHSVWIWFPCLRSIGDTVLKAKTPAEFTSPRRPNGAKAGSSSASSVVADEANDADGKENDGGDEVAVEQLPDYAEDEIQKTLVELRNPVKTDKTLPFDHLNREKDMAATSLELVEQKMRAMSLGRGNRSKGPTKAKNFQASVEAELRRRTMALDDGIRRIETDFYDAVNKHLKDFNDAKKRIHGEYEVFLDGTSGREILTKRFEMEEQQMLERHAKELEELRMRRESECSAFETRLPQMRKKAVFDYVAAKQNFCAVQMELEDSSCADLRKLLMTNLPVPQAFLGSQYLLACPLNIDSEQPSTFMALDLESIHESDGVEEDEEEHERKQLFKPNIVLVHILAPMRDMIRFFNHGHIVPVADAIHTNDFSFLVTPYLPKTLSDYIHELDASSLSSMRGPVAATFLFHLLRAIHYLHHGLEDGVCMVHRELCPSQVLLKNGDPTWPCIKHFGLMRSLEGFEKPSHRDHGWMFAAPELYGPRPQIGPQSDMWSIGVIFAYMIESRDGRHSPLYSGENAGDVLKGISALVGKPSQNDVLRMMKFLNAELEARAFFESVLGSGKAAVMELQSRENLSGVLDKRFKHELSPEEFDLLKSLLRFVPQDRLSAADALQHSFFEKNLPSSVKEEHAEFLSMLSSATHTAQGSSTGTPNQSRSRSSSAAGSVSSVPSTNASSSVPG